MSAFILEFLAFIGGASLFLGVTFSRSAAAKIKRAVLEVLQSQDTQRSLRKAAYGSPYLEKIGKTDEYILQDGSGDVSVYEGTTKGSETATGAILENVHNRLGDVSADSWVHLKFRGGGWEIVSKEGLAVRLGKTTTDHDKDSTELVSLYNPDGTKGSESDTGSDFYAYNRFADLASGKWVLAIKIGSGWDLIAAECGE